MVNKVRAVKWNIQVDHVEENIRADVKNKERRDVNQTFLGPVSQNSPWSRRQNLKSKPVV